MNLSQFDFITTAYLFLVVGGLISLFGAIIVYLNRKSRKKRLHAKR